MSAALDRFLRELARDFLFGDLGELSSRYAHPLAVYVNGDIRVELDPTGTRAALDRRRRVAIAAGAREIEAEVLEIAEDAEHRFVAEVLWRYRDAAGREIETSLIRYFCRPSGDGGFRVEILEFLRQAFPGR
jgi:hypothetical protein